MEILDATIITPAIPLIASSLGVFTLASVGCAASVSLPMLVAMRVVQGVGGALMVPVGRLLVLRSSAKGDLVRAIAWLTWPALAAPVLAPILGGAVATVGSWRWIFIVNIPLGIIGFLLSLRLIRGEGVPSPAPLDWRGGAPTGGRHPPTPIALGSHPVGRPH